MDIHALHPSFFDREKNLVAFSNSLLKAFGLPAFHESIPEVDEILKGKKKIAVFLFDGLGAMVQDALPRQAKELRAHAFLNIYSTNPATTVAATDAVRSARYPIETGWLGWTQYFEELKTPVNCFPLKNALTDERLNLPKNIMREHCPYVSVSNQLFHAGIKAKESFQESIKDALEDPENPPLRANNLRAMKKGAESFFNNGGQFLYSYYPEPDHSMHQYGVHSLHSKWNVRRINAMVKSFAKKNKDVTLLVIADHGLIDVEYVDLASIPELSACLDKSKGIVIETRTPSFFVLEDKKEEFETLFERHFGADTVLMTKEEALKSGFFGEGTMHSMAESFLGDYVAVNLGNTCFYDSTITPKKKVMKGHHAGGQDMERLVRISVWNA